MLLNSGTEVEKEITLLGYVYTIKPAHTRGFSVGCWLGTKTEI